MFEVGFVIHLTDAISLITLRIQGDTDYNA